MKHDRTIADTMTSLEKRLGSLEAGQQEILRLLRRLVGDCGGLGDGPVAPDKLRLAGQLYSGFPRLEWLLLSRLWGRDAVPVQDAMDHVYGAGEEGVEAAFASVCKRLNKALVDRDCPASVFRRAGYVALDVSRPAGR